MDINQCEWGNERGARSPRTITAFWNTSAVINAFRNTHKCDRETTKVLTLIPCRYIICA
jgi:hypothetical protein